MLAYVIRRLLWAGALVVAMTFVTFVILFKIPNDPARFLVPNQNPAEYQLEAAREKLGVDDPFFVQYGRFLWRVRALRPRLLVRVGRAARAGPGHGGAARRDPGDGVAARSAAAVIWLRSRSHSERSRPSTRARPSTGRLLVFVLLGISSHPVVVGLFFRQILGYELGLAPVEGYCPMVGQGRLRLQSGGRTTCSCPG